MQSIPQEIIIYILLGISLVLAAWIIRLELKLKRLCRGKSGGSLEDAIKSIEDDLKGVGMFQSEVETYLKKVETRLSRSIQGVHNLSYSAFQGLDSGGGQSFATALLNENGDGVIFSTMHSRDRVNVFSKDIKNFKSNVKLSDEEQSALTKAQESCKL
jgi:hypothetical protein